jgi:hypothetical protein
MIIEIIGQWISQAISIIEYYLFNFWSKEDFGATRLKDIIQIVAFFVGTIWAVFKILEFRELKHKIQFEIDAHMYKLEKPITACTKTYDKRKDLVCNSPKLCTHFVEVLFKFTNKGNRRFRLYNLKTIISTMPDDVKIRDTDCGLSLERLLTSGNIVPEKLIPEKLPMKERLRNFLLRKKPAGFYYIEPGIEQIISYFCIIRKPNEILQVRGCFSLEQQRLFPKEFVGSMGLYPHTAERTYQLDRAGKITKDYILNDDPSGL